ncbi:MAG: hypothetical protein KatS3mg085_379 [Candidatus Dojkabacteria bacterium]|nr:MAG: hypothetical protein KatS3mg085_379 [Candidatus Dojkabacteria bacterium]
MYEQIILGVDVGFAITGWAILESSSKINLLDYGAITTKSKLSIDEIG